MGGLCILSRLNDAILILIGVAGLAVLDWRGLALPAPHPDAVGQLTAAFQESAPLIPARGFVGYVLPGGATVSDGEIRFIAQYALAPRVLVDDLTDAHVAIAPPGIQPARHTEMIAGRWAHVATLPAGVRVYRR